MAYARPFVLARVGSCCSSLSACCSLIISLLLSTVAVRLRRSRGEGIWVWIMAACSLAHVG